MANPLFVPVLFGLCAASATVVAATATETPDARAAALVREMSPEELGVMVHGPMALPMNGEAIPPGAVAGAGFIPGIPRLKIPPLTETDASLGVAWVSGLRKDGATPLPSGIALASTWDPDMLQTAGAMIGGEAHAKGFNVLLAGGANLAREPRNGRTFEYLGEDPWLVGTLGGAAIAGIQSAHVISTIKHFALNDQETGRQFLDVHVSEAAARESDLLAFQIAIERGQPGSVMCSYNRINGAWGCGNDALLNGVLKGDWRYPGWVMSDWGATHSLDYALKGLDQQSGDQLDADTRFSELVQLARTDARYAERLKNMNQRILRSMFAVGVDAHPPVTRTIDFAANAAIAEKAALKGIVLLRNKGNALPLTAASLKRIAVIGGYADTGVLSGGGSSQVHSEGGPALARPAGGDSPFQHFLAEQYHRSNPLKAISAMAPGAEVIFRNGRFIADAVAAARKSDVAIIFATQPMCEGLDVPELSLPDGQDALIAAVAAANPRTIVVLETGGPVLMPWLDKVAGVLEAWYPGARGGEAIAAVIFGKANPSGRLPITFPASESQLPRPALPGQDTIEPDFVGRARPGESLTVDYDIEGSDVGYRWYAREGLTPLFPFGYGLSYSTYESSRLRVSTGKNGLIAEARVRNTGSYAGADVVQVYLSSLAGKSVRRLVGYARVELAPGEVRAVRITMDPRLLALWQNGAWHRPAGVYRFTLGRSSLELGEAVEIELGDSRWSDGDRGQTAGANARPRT